MLIIDSEPIIKRFQPRYESTWRSQVELLPTTCLKRTKEAPHETI